MVFDVARTKLQMGGVDRCVWMRRIWGLAILLLAAFSAPALEVQQVIWGFDGQAVPGRFNVLSVLVANSAGDPFDGTMNLSENRGMDERLGAVYGAPCYLSPMTTRWLQFYVYIDNQYDGWRLQWGRGSDDQHDLDAPKLGTPATVLLLDPDATMAGGGAFKQFPDDLFPTTIAATAGLNSVLLDHAPRWEPLKRQAFLSWLKAGGTVHVLTGPDGRYPEFTDELAGLNSPLDRFRIGAGTVVRHAARAGEIQRRDVDSDGPPLRQDKPENLENPGQSSDLFFRVLTRLSQRHYNWSGIYLLAIAYVVVAGPGILMAGRKLADYRLRIALLLATVAGFTFLFNLAGRRGQGETSAIHSLSYAREIAGGTYDVVQWINVFTAHGAYYTITHPAADNLYSTSEDYEAVNGVIENGKDGRFRLDLPMFSQRSFMHAAEMKGPDAPVKITSWQGGETLKHLVLGVDRDFAKQILSGWILQGDQIYPAVITKDGLECNGSDAQPVRSFTALSGSEQFAINNGYQPQEQGANDMIPYQYLVKPLIAWSLETVDLTQSKALARQAGGHVQLFVFAHSPASFGVAGSDLGHETGCVLYHFDLFQSANPGNL